MVAYKLDAMERTIEADKRTANEVQHSRRIVWKLPRGPNTDTPVPAARPVGCHSLAPLGGLCYPGLRVLR